MNTLQNSTRILGENMCWMNSAFEGSIRLGYDAVWIGKQLPIFRGSLQPQTPFGVPEDLLRIIANYLLFDKELESQKT